MDDRTPVVDVTTTVSRILASLDAAAHALLVARESFRGGLNFEACAHLTAAQLFTLDAIPELLALAGIHVTSEVLEMITDHAWDRYATDPRAAL